MARKTKYPLKFSGFVNWMFGTEEDVRELTVKRALMRSPNEIILDFSCEGYSYAAILHRISATQFEGQFNGMSGPRLSPCKATATLYFNVERYLLIGKWIEEGYESVWWTELKQVEHFADEEKHND